MRPFGHALNVGVSLARPWLSLGPGWAMLAGALSTGTVRPTSAQLVGLVSVWLLVDPILGTLWHLAVERGIWRKLFAPQLPPPPSHGFYIPYAQPDSMAGQLSLTIRRYQRWWGENYWATHNHHVIGFAAGVVVALLLALVLGPAILGLTVLALIFIVMASFRPPDLSALSGGRLQSLVQLLIPWAIGAWWASQLTLVSLLFAVCFWVTYLGGLRMLGQHRRAEMLFFLGQIAAIVLLLTLRVVPGAALLSILVMAQLLLYRRLSTPDAFLTAVQWHLVAGIVIAGASVAL